MSNLPWFKFFPSDWRADSALRMVSMGARALWIEMLCVMHEGEPRGHLTVAGRPVTSRQLAILAGCMVDEVDAHLGELEASGVFSRTSEGVIFSRKMVRDTRKSDEQRARVNARWSNPASIETIDKNRSGNTEVDTETVPHIPEARSQKPEPDNRLEAKASVADGDAARPVYDAEFELAWKAYPHVKGRSSRPTTYPFWKKAVKAAGGSMRLQVAIETFARKGQGAHGDKGAAGMHLWLKGARYEDWLPVAPVDAVPVDAETLAWRKRRFEEINEWKDSWGPRPARPHLKLVETPALAVNEQAGANARLA